MAEVNVCTICQSSLHDGRDFVTTRCQHMFHTECIASNASANSNKCPNCRASIPSFRKIFTGFQSTTEKSKEKIISNEDDEAGWNCPACTYKNSSNIDICETCRQGMRVQADKLKQNNDIPKPVREEPIIKLTCNTPFCNTHDPSINILCDKCISALCVAPFSSEISDNPQRAIQTNPLVPPYRSFNTTNSIPIEIEQIQTYETEWRCEYCDYPDNLSSNEQCIYCQQGHRPKQITSSPTNFCKSSITPQTGDQQTKQGNVLFQSVFSPIR
ncbi:unnamed protein product, partial [Didymodactylos carnosus]